MAAILLLIPDLAEALDSAATAMATQPQDHAHDHRDAWIFGILCGWDEALDEVAAKHRWSDETIARLRRYRQAVEEITKEMRP